MDPHPSVLMNIRKMLFLLACLGFAADGRRLRNVLGNDKGILESSKALTGFLLASNPKAAFNPALPRTRPVMDTSVVASSRSGRPCMMDLATLAAPYLNSLHDHYFATTAVQAFTLVGTGDLCAQMIELQAAKRDNPVTTTDDAHDTKDVYDPLRTLRFALLGLFLAGFGTATWLQFLEHSLPAGSGTWAAEHHELPAWAFAPLIHALEGQGLDLGQLLEANLVLVKATIDACIWAPIANGGYLILTPLTEGKSLETAIDKCKKDIVDVMKTELATFFPYNLISFSLIPPLVRPFTTASLSMCFAIYISWITHLAQPAAASTNPETNKGIAQLADSVSASTHLDIDKENAQLARSAPASTKLDIDKEFAQLSQAASASTNLDTDKENFENQVDEEMRNKILAPVFIPMNVTAGTATPSR